jgi:hypothetical protein
MSHGCQATNVRRGVRAGLELMKAGLNVFSPHLSWFADLFDDNPPNYERWISLDFDILSRCDALLRIPGESPGADREVDFAMSHNIPVFYTVSDVIAWSRNER